MTATRLTARRPQAEPQPRPQTWQRAAVLLATVLGPLATAAGLAALIGSLQPSAVWGHAFTHLLPALAFGSIVALGLRFWGPPPAARVQPLARRLVLASLVGLAGSQLLEAVSAFVGTPRGDGLLHTVTMVSTNLFLLALLFVALPLTVVAHAAAARVPRWLLAAAGLAVAVLAVGFLTSAVGLWSAGGE